MTYEFNRHYEPYIVQIEYTGRIIGKEIEESMYRLLMMLQEGPLYILVDFSQAQNIPPGLFDLSAPAQVINHASTVWFAVVTGDTPRTSTTRLLAGDNIKLFPDHASALAFLLAMVRSDTGKVL